MKYFVSNGSILTKFKPYSQELYDALFVGSSRGVLLENKPIAYISEMEGDTIISVVVERDGKQKTFNLYMPLDVWLGVLSKVEDYDKFANKNHTIEKIKRLVEGMMMYEVKASAECEKNGFSDEFKNLKRKFTALKRELSNILEESID